MQEIMREIMREIMLFAILALVSACDFTPATVESSDIDNAVAMGRLPVICKGLKMSDPEVRRYAASRLEEIEDPKALACVCEDAIDPKSGAWDEAILSGLKGSGRDDLAACFLPALDDPRNDRRLELVVALDFMTAPAAKARLKAIALDPNEDADTREVALRMFAGATGEDLASLLNMLANDESDGVRATAARMLKGQKNEQTTAALTAAATGDDSGVVRARALLTLRQMASPESDAMACKAMMSDPDPQVRSTAILSYRGTKRAGPMKCLKKRMMTVEEDSGVRVALLALLSKVPAKEVKPILCDAIPFWVKNYVTERHPSDMPGTDIITAQNDRDWENSYVCVQKAYRKRGAYTCKGKQYVAAWFRELGGDSHIPKCPGDPPTAATTISME
jgi:HEAT repeat protein